MSSLVTLTIDSDRLLDAPAGTVLVEKLADYPRACLAIRDALNSRRRTTIGVRHRVAAAWLTAYAQGCGDEAVAVRPYTPRDALAQKWQVDVPPGVTDAEIMQSGLLDVPLSAREGQSFADLILEHFYSDLLAFRTLPVAQLGALLNRYDPARWKAASRRPAVLRLWKERVGQWYDRAQNDAVRALVAALREDPDGLRRDLCHFKVLRNYPVELGSKVLGPRWDVFRTAKVDTDALDLAHGGPEAVTQIEYHLSALRDTIGGANDVALLLRNMSGYLDTEFRFVETLLRDHPDWISADLLRRIEQRFAPIEARTGKALAALRKRVKPPFPEAPHEGWDAPRWLAWVRDSYMPYYGWLEAQDAQDETVSEYAATFADWYYDHFVALKNGEPERFAFTALYRERDAISAEDAVTLALLVDNFNFVHFDMLCDLFRAQGMSLASSEPVFSLIPTATEVGKAALIATTGDQIDLPATSYPGLVAKGWNANDAGHPAAAYLPNIGALQQLAARDHALYFLNYLPIDDTLHQDAQETGRAHEEVIYEHLATLAKSVADFATRFQLGKRLGVFVLSDHGATRIARGVVNVLDASYYKSLALQNHHRYLALADDKFKHLPQAASQQCYLIDRERFKTNQNYLAARRYYRFLTTTGSFYVHGGLTPEEVVVPFARFSFIPVVPDAPTLSLLTSQFRVAVRSTVSVEVGNPNGFPLEAVTVRLTDVADADEVVLDRLGAKEKVVVAFTAVFRKAIGGSDTRPVTVRVGYRHQGASYAAPDREFTVTAKAMMEDNNDFSDLFDV